MKDQFFGYGFKVLDSISDQPEFESIILIKNIPKEFIIMQLQVFLDDLKEDYHNQHGRKQQED